MKDIRLGSDALDAEQLVVVSNDSVHLQAGRYADPGKVEEGEEGEEGLLTEGALSH